MAQEEIPRVLDEAVSIGKARPASNFQGVRDLIRRMSSANPFWGAPRIVGELGKIGIDLPKSTVAKYMVRHRKSPSPTWRAFLKNHIEDIVAIDFIVVPTVRNQVLFVLLILAHQRRVKSMGIEQVLRPCSAKTRSAANHRVRGWVAYFRRGPRPDGYSPTASS